MHISKFQTQFNTNVHSQKDERQYADNDGRVVVLLPFQDFVEWKHKLMVTFKIFLQLAELLPNKSRELTTVTAINKGTTSSKT